MKKISGLVIAGLSGDSGKTLVSCGITAALKNKGLKVSSFKKGPDYIDPAWLSLAAGSSCRNLDTYLMTKKKIISSFHASGSISDISVIEGNRGLFDGFDASGTHSTAELAKLLRLPVVLVINVTKVTRTVAAIALGCKMIDNKLNLAGIVINKVAGKRHEKVIREAVEKETNIPVVGAIPKIKGKEIFPSRHLGLVTPGEHSKALMAIENAAEAVEDHIDFNKIIEISKSAEYIEFENSDLSEKYANNEVRIGYFSDRAFSFYYPENLEHLNEKGAELIKINSFDQSELPDIDLLYIGGGFPETNIENLTINKSLMQSLRDRVEKGLPVYAECGGLMYLAESVETAGKKYDMANVLPIEVKMNKKPQGHGYMEVEVDNDNPYFENGDIVRGHEFHYSGITTKNDTLKTCFNVKRGSGCFDKRDGLIYKNVFASYFHLHSLSNDSWSKNMIDKAKEYKRILNSSIDY